MWTDPDPFLDKQFFFEKTRFLQFCDFLMTCLLFLTTDIKVTTARNKQNNFKKLFFVDIYKAFEEKSRIRIRNPLERAGDTDPYQNATAF